MTTAQPAQRDYPAPPPLPDFVDPADLARKALERLEPPRRITVSEAAARHRILRNPGGGYSGPWQNDQVPYCREPMDMVTNRRKRGLVFVAGAQSAKTEALILNPVCYSVIYDPADMAIVTMSDAEARDFSRRRLDRMNAASLDMWRRLDRGGSGDNVFDKAYRGMLLSIGAPTIRFLSSKPIPRVGFTDYDRMPDDVDGEGAPFDLGMKRTQTFGSRGITIAESSPGRPIQKAKWTPSTPHEAPPTTGILALYNRGDRRRWYWPCPHCGEYFEGAFRHLWWPPDAGPAEAADDVRMICPANGCVIEPKHKRAMNEAGVWVPEGTAVSEDGVLSGTPRRSEIASYWLKGTASAFQPWGQLVSNYLAAVAEYETTGSEQALKTTVNVDQAEAYLPKAAEANTSLEADVLERRAEPYPIRVVPAAARFMTAAVDVQGNRFEVLVRAWGVKLESWVVDRFTLFKAEDGGAERPLDPARHAEDWDLLFDAILARRYPLAEDDTCGLAVAVMTVDSAGQPGVTPQAYDFYRRAKKRGCAGRVALTKGASTAAAPRIRMTLPDSDRKDRHAQARGEIPVWQFNTNSLKDELANQLGREEPGAQFVHLSRDLRDAEPPHTFFEELTAEERGPDGKWKKVKPRNETFDLMVMSHVGVLALKADRIDWAAGAPPWAAPLAENALVAAAGSKAIGAGAGQKIRRRRVRSKGV